MKAMLLAAGRGERMRPLTDRVPKPLLEAGGKPLIVWHIEKLAAAGFREVVINHAWLGEQIPAALGDGSALGVHLQYSAESTGGLETAGGIARALPLLTEGESANAPFAVISSDVWSDVDYGQLHAVAGRLAAGEGDCWCLMASNPPHHPQGDFVLREGYLHLRPDAGAGAQNPADTGAEDGSGAPGLTYSGIGVFCPAMFSHIADGMVVPLRPLLELAIDAGRALGAHHEGQWFDIGTPERLAQLNTLLGHQASSS